MSLHRTHLAAALSGLLLSSCGFMDSSRSGGPTWVEYRGWGPMANLETPYSPNESGSYYFEEKRERARHVAEVEAARSRVWDANAPVRAAQARR